MRRSRVSLLLVAAALCLGQSGSQLVTPEIRRVGVHLGCLCGSCKNTVADCAMLECHYSKPARMKIIAMQKEGRADQAIVDQFVKDEGRRALAVPPAEGFHLLAWIAPFAVIGAGLVLIWWFVRRLRRPSETPALDARVLDRYREQIDRDISQLD